MLLSDAVDAFLADRRAKGFSKATLRNERDALRNLLADVGNIQLHRMRPQHLDTFWSKHDWSPGTMNRIRTHLRVFFRWAQARGHLPRHLDLMDGTRIQRVPQRSRVIIPQEEFEPLLDSIKDPRARAAVAIGLYLFTRKSETEDLRWQDINFQRREIDVYRRKTRELDTLPMCEELERELRRWKLAYAAAQGEEVRPGWYVIPGCAPPLRFGTKGVKGFTSKVVVKYRPDTRANLSNKLTEVLQEAGYYRPQEGGHTLRRSGAIALYNQLTDVGHDRSIRLVQAMLGHTSIRTTEVYLRLSLDRKVRNDLLAGRPMFPGGGTATVLQLKAEVDGPTNVDRA